MVSAPFSANFMLPVPEASVPAVEICSDRSAAGMITLGQRDAVVGQEHQLQPVADARVAVDHARDVVDQLDHRLGGDVGGGRLAGEDHRARHAPASSGSATIAW